MARFAVWSWSIWSLYVSQLENVVSCLSLLNSLGVAIEGVSASDVCEGNLKSILGLFFSLSRYKQKQRQQQKHLHESALATSANSKWVCIVVAPKHIFLWHHALGRKRLFIRATIFCDVSGCHLRRPGNAALEFQLRHKETQTPRVIITYYSVHWIYIRALGTVIFHRLIIITLSCVLPQWVISNALFEDNSLSLHAYYFLLSLFRFTVKLYRIPFTPYKLKFLRRVKTNTHNLIEISFTVASKTGSRPENLSSSRPNSSIGTHIPAVKPTGVYNDKTQRWNFNGRPFDCTKNLLFCRSGIRPPSIVGLSTLNSSSINNNSVILTNDVSSTAKKANSNNARIYNSSSISTTPRLNKQGTWHQNIICYCVWLLFCSGCWLKAHKLFQWIQFCTLWEKWLLNKHIKHSVSKINLN